MNQMTDQGRIKMVNGPVVGATDMLGYKMREMVMVGYLKLIGEIIAIDGNEATIQVYEETEGLRIGEPVSSTGKPLSLKLGPGLLGNIFDGIERPLLEIEKNHPGFINEGIGMIAIDEEKLWAVEIEASVGQHLIPGLCLGSFPETPLIEFRWLVPPGIEGEVIWCAPSGRYNIMEPLIRYKTLEGDEATLCLLQEWPVRSPRPVTERLALSKPLLTGQRVLDVFFPIAKGGTAAIPGGFGTGKTMTQHQLAKWSDADIIVYIGCGERGNEMTDVLEQFPKLIDPKSGRPIMDRTVLIANTSNMPVAAREASIYTGITIAEFYRDMGYDVAIMADSTSRWAEALREISGRLEEMPAEDGYPAYLPSRLAEFYERAGYVRTLEGRDASVTIIGAVSPAGGDFSEPVTENTKRFVNAFLALDKKLAYARHYPSIHWLNSYSGYLKILAPWYAEHVSADLLELRAEMIRLLFEENKLADIVQLVGEDVLPDDQRLILEISKVLKIGFLQQNAFHKDDTYVPIQKQYQMLVVIGHLYDRGLEAVQKGIPISVVKDETLFADVTKMKYDIPNDNLSGLEILSERIDDFYDALIKKYT